MAPDVMTNAQLKDLVATARAEVRALRLENKGETVSRYRDPPTRFAVDVEPTLGDKLHTFNHSLREGPAGSKLALGHEAKFNPHGNGNTGRHGPSREAFLQDVAERQRKGGDRYLAVKPVVKTRRRSQAAALVALPVSLETKKRRLRMQPAEHHLPRYYAAAPMVVKISAACPMGKVLQLPKLQPKPTPSRALDHVTPPSASAHPTTTPPSSPPALTPRPPPKRLSARSSLASVVSAAVASRRGTSHSFRAAAEEEEDPPSSPPSSVPRRASVAFVADPSRGSTPVPTTPPLAPRPPSEAPPSRAGSKPILRRGSSRRVSLPPAADRSDEASSARSTGVWRP
eukprot:TRINITY_DN23135_c0_g1_i1.p1 TRINITY_DN23135_c0_g1~~TRINITY_DN23135_c0_g1_i1.p1  ORF type:complete len:367 (+),score=110.01 TRINITY_DN23135_c0_g1_i1:76-1101(+)